MPSCGNVINPVSIIGIQIHLAVAEDVFGVYYITNINYGYLRWG